MMITLTEALLAAVLVFLIVLIYLVLRRGRIEPGDIELAVSSVWKDSGLDQQVGKLEVYAQDIRRDYRSLDQMLRVPAARGSLGEIALEQILADQLPSDMFGIRQRILDGKVPDAHINSTVGVICIDSKFPLDNYRKMLEAGETAEREKLKRQFLRDVQGHLRKVADDYVCCRSGSAEFAFAFIPSESVYYFLVTESYDTLRDFTSKGVQVVSPLTLSHKVELIKAGVLARRLNEQAERIREDLGRLSKQFAEVDEQWHIFYSTHLRNAERKADELDSAYRGLREEFSRISRVTGE